MKVTFVADKPLMMSEPTITLHLGGMDVSPDAAARAAVGMRLAAYRFDKYRTKLAAFATARSSRGTWLMNRQM